MTLARYLNVACGCTTFDVFNVDLVPDVVVKQIQTIMEMQAGIGRLSAAKGE